MVAQVRSDVRVLVLTCGFAIRYPPGGSAPGASADGSVSGWHRLEAAVAGRCAQYVPKFQPLIGQPGSKLHGASGLAGCRPGASVVTSCFVAQGLGVFHGHVNALLRG